MILFTHALAAVAGALALYAFVKAKLDYLKRITDRDERGRFKK